MNIVEQVNKSNGVDEQTLETLSRVKAYYKGKETATMEIQKLLDTNIVLTKEELASIKNESFVKGFEEGKRIFIYNLKIWLNENFGGKAL